MRFGPFSRAIGLSIAFSLSFLILLTLAAEEQKQPAAAENPSEEAVFEMREISAFGKGREDSYRLTRGQYAPCSETPDKEVKAYPKLNSKRPLYGKIKFGDNRLDPVKGEGIEFRFVLDESGEEPKTESKEENESPSLLKTIRDSIVGGDSQKGASPLLNVPLSRYDRLYFDINHDLDLTNDPVLKPLANVPWDSLPPWQVQEKAAFEYLNVDFDYGPGAGVRPFRVLPWLSIGDEGKSTVMHFVAAKARSGTIKLGKRKYDALLAQPYVISGRFDWPAISLYLKPLGFQNDLPSWGFEGDSLSTMHRVDGELYTISSSPLGDKLTVKPYRGDYGVFTVGPGGRKIDEKAIFIRGSLRSKTAEVGFGPEPAKSGEQEQKIKECKIPVGDYLTSALSIEYGRLRIFISDNYHADGKARTFDNQTYGIKIDKDKPYVLDFSNKPEVLFASPAKDKTFKRGDAVEVKAVLIDPVLDIMIRNLDDTTRKKKETVKYGDGQESTYEKSFSLDPLVTITDSAGEKVAEGLMPFG
jgi:hypothetical protein